MDGLYIAKIAPYMFPALWVLWLLYWRIQARGTKSNAWRESTPSRLMHVVPTAVAALLLVLPTASVPVLNRRWLPWSFAVFWVGWLFAAAGLLFTVWARRHLASNWSADVTLKADHELITSGPYALVRHPIYTGLLMGFVGSALALGEWRGLIAVAIMILTLWRKLRVEERRMRQLFGAAYQNYQGRVSALIPFVF
ncbi:MAG TPA: isoprenylcysteine carboxylmethyltransferase family protein [Steroidobacteraceae bacterium]